MRFHRTLQTSKFLGVKSSELLLGRENKTVLIKSRLLRYHLYGPSPIKRLISSALPVSAKDVLKKGRNAFFDRMSINSVLKEKHRVQLFDFFNEDVLRVKGMMPNTFNDWGC